MDQFHYSHIRNTDARDIDQVATRQTKDESFAGRLIVIDQLWLHLWVVDTEEDNFASARILTAFPYTAYARLDSQDPNANASELYDNADVLDVAVRTLEAEKWDDVDTSRAQTLACSILSNAVLSTLSVNTEDTIEFLELFREAIGNATDQYANYFRKFTEATSQLGTNSDTGSESAKIKQIQLGIEVEDIIDELYMLKRLFNTQKLVLEQGYEATRERPHLKVMHDRMKELSRRISVDYMPQTEQLTSDSERLRKSLFDLLDLQQKEESVREARSANQQALFTAKQALSAHDQAAAAEAQSLILFIFTVVTIVFLPLSFLTSFFGMFDVNNDRGEKASLSYSYVQKAMWGFSAPFYTLALGIAGALYYFRMQKSRRNWVQKLIDLDRKGYLPRDLIDKGGKLFKKMEKMRKEDKRYHIEFANREEQTAPEMVRGREDVPSREAYTVPAYLTIPEQALHALPKAKHRAQYRTTSALAKVPGAKAGITAQAPQDVGATSKIKRNRDIEAQLPLD